MIGYYLEVAPDDSIVQCHAIALPSEIALDPVGSANRLVPASAPPAAWIGTTPTQVLYLVNGEAAWVETATLEQARVAAWAAAKADRDAAEAAPFEFEGGMYDPNKENISGAALAALLAQLSGQDVTRTWTLADNSRRLLTGTQIIALGLALTERVDAIHARGRELRDLIDNAVTPAQAFGYTWESLDV